MGPYDLSTVRDRLHDVAPPELQLVVLFGSVARDRAGPQSDVDVAVLCDGAADLDQLFLVVAPAFRTDRLDLVDLRRAGSRQVFLRPIAMRSSRPRATA